MIQEIISYLQDSPSGSRPMAYQRNDGTWPFDDLTEKPLLIRQQGGRSDKDISRQTFDIWLFTAANPSNSDVAAMFDEAKLLGEYIVTNYKDGRVYFFDVISTASGPFLDGQGRQSLSLSFIARRSTGN